MIPRALYQAELELYSNSPGGGRVLNQYIRTILDIIVADFVPKVENIIGVEVKQVIPLIDMDAGWAMAFFKTN